MGMLVIDGGMGEGGGQILRTSLALSAILARPVRITDIRATRSKPGLRPQHLTGLLAITEVCSARAEGARTGSQEVVFEPGPVRPGRYLFDVSKTTASAGSVTLVMQTVLPALASAEGPSQVTLMGGTHVPWSPPFHFIAGCFLPALARMGIDADADISRWGYYPRGGGEVSFRVSPAAVLTPLELAGPGKLLRVTGLLAVSGLPMSIAERQAGSASEHLRANGIEPDIRTADAPSHGPGTFMHLSAEFAGAAMCFSALGERGKRAEKVGEEAASELVRFVGSGACVEEHLADQLILYMAIADGVSRMSVSKITRHLLTNIEVVRLFLPDVVIRVEGGEGGPGRVEVVPPAR